MESIGYYTGTYEKSRSYTVYGSLILCPQSLGWEHYEVHEPEPHILLFKYAPLNDLTPYFRRLTIFQATNQLRATKAIELLYSRLCFCVFDRDLGVFWRT